MEAVLNGFLSRHRVVNVERRFVENGAESFSAICVDYLKEEWTFAAWAIRDPV